MHADYHPVLPFQFVDFQRALEWIDQPDVLYPFTGIDGHFAHAVKPPSKETLAMRISTTVQPGQRGAKQFFAHSGDRLGCLRYRYAEQHKKRFKTRELIVEEWAGIPPPPQQAQESLVLVRVALPERELRRQVKGAGGIGKPVQEVWEVGYEHAIASGLAKRSGEDSSC